MKPDLPDLQTIEAILASLRLWVLDVLAALLERFGRNGPIARDVAAILRKSLRSAERDMKIAILGLALRRMPPRSTKRSHHRHPHPGFALRRYRQSDLRLLLHGTFNRMGGVNLRTRIARLRDMIDAAHAIAARLLKRLVRGFNGHPRILAGPPA
ncbi:MAG: hypothetical protein JNJ73_03965, partial [Hyphomonadaceae bacterium]|nr:hypothetical protein [Hyphomonadaceae bacterium]